MSTTSRQSIQTLANDLTEVLAWGAAAEAANSSLREMLEMERASVLQHVATIAAKDAELASGRDSYMALFAELGDAEAEIERLKAELALLKPRFLLGDATRQQFLGAPFTEPFPICYESELYPNSVTQAQRPNVTIDRAFVLNNTMPDWRTRYPNAPRWIADIEWQNSSGITAAEVAKIRPGFQGAREFAAAEGRGLKIGAYGFPPRFGTHMTDDEVRAQRAIVQPILDLCDETILTLYPIYTDLAQSRTYIRRNIAMGRELGRKVYVLGWPVWHSNVGAPLAGTPVSVEWWRMMLEEVRAGADGFAPWLKAAAPKPTTEPWWLQTQDWHSGMVA